MVSVLEDLDADSERLNRARAGEPNPLANALPPNEGADRGRPVRPEILAALCSAFVCAGSLAGILVCTGSARSVRGWSGWRRGRDRVTHRLGSVVIQKAPLSSVWDAIAPCECGRRFFGWHLATVGDAHDLAVAGYMAHLGRTDEAAEAAHERLATRA